MRMVGVDPGFDRCGIAVMERWGVTERLLHSECVESSKKDAFPKRLKAVGDRLNTIITEFTPTAIAFETLFFNANVKTALRVAEVRGVLEYVAERNGLHIYEYSPQAVKIAVTGYGKSDKAAVEAMVERLVRPEKPIRFDDEYDAIAIALTALAHMRTAAP